MSDRKYRQQGYQDSGPRKREAPPAPRPRPSGPRGRGLGKPTATVIRCAVCGAQQDVDRTDQVTAGSKCGNCEAELHTCTHCVHFDPSATFECRAPVAERVANKAKANRCELFEVRSTAELAADAGKPSSAKDAFDALFKGI